MIDVAISKGQQEVLAFAFNYCFGFVRRPDLYGEEFQLGSISLPFLLMRRSMRWPGLSR
jgi:hypothetical protein